MRTGDERLENAEVELVASARVEAHEAPARGVRAAVASELLERRQSPAQCLAAVAQQLPQVRLECGIETKHTQAIRNVERNNKQSEMSEPEDNANL